MDYQNIVAQYQGSYLRPQGSQFPGYSQLAHLCGVS